MRQLKITKQVTNRDIRSIDRYLQEIGQIDLITADEEAELAQLIKEGDQKALKTLVNVNLRFVISVAKQYQNRGLTLQDLINEGNIGLVKAAKRFDETRGFKFISYAVWWIRQSILQALAEQVRVVRLPLNRIGAINKINKAIARLEQDNQRMPTVHEIAEFLDMTVDKVEQSIKNSRRYLSMDAPLKKGETFSLYDVVNVDNSPSPSENLMQESLRIEINRSLDTLPVREADVIKLFYGLGNREPLTLSEIGDFFELTRERVRQIKEKALRRLRHRAKTRLLKTYLG